jgi:hypothetical protein
LGHFCGCFNIDTLPNFDIVKNAKQFYRIFVQYGDFGETDVKEKN